MRRARHMKHGEVAVGFSKNGQNEDYVTGNESLATFFGIDDVFDPTVTDHVSKGNIQDVYVVPEAEEGQPAGEATAEYSKTRVRCGWKETYSFASTEWDGVKNISLKASGKKLTFNVENFVQADMDMVGVKHGVDLNFYNLKRSNILTGNGCDDIHITTATNSTSWINKHNISTGNGHDKVVISMGDESLVDSSIVTFVDGSLTETFVWLGNGRDIFISEAGVKMADHVWGEKGNDIIKTGDGDDFLYGGKQHDKLYGGAGEDALDGGHGRDVLNGGADQDMLTGGTGKDRFVFSSADEDIVTDFEVNRDILDISDLVDMVGDADVLANINDYVSLAKDGADTLVSFDVDGAGAAAAEVVARLQSVEFTGATLDSLITAGVIDVA